MMLRHDAPVTIHMESGLSHYASNTPCTAGIARCDYEHKTLAYLVDAALSIEAVKHGKISGNVSPIRCKYSLTLDDPSFELKDGELCTCVECVPT